MEWTGIIFKVAIFVPINYHLHFILEDTTIESLSFSTNATVALIAVETHVDETSSISLVGIMF